MYLPFLCQMWEARVRESLYYRKERAQVGEPNLAPLEWFESHLPGLAEFPGP
jgi:hypothetical protein